MHLPALIALPLVVAFTASAAGHHKDGHQIPPGQLKKMNAPGQMQKVYDPEVTIPAEVEFVCLVTTEIAGDPHSRVAYTEWLPRGEAESKADEGRSFVIYHPDLNTEEGCIGF